MEWILICRTRIQFRVYTKIHQKNKFSFLYSWEAHHDTNVLMFRAFQSIWVGFFCLCGLVSWFLSSSFSSGWEQETALFSPFHFLSFLQSYSSVVIRFPVNFLLAFWEASGIKISCVTSVVCIYIFCYLYTFFCKAWYCRTTICIRLL